VSKPQRQEMGLYRTGLKNPRKEHRIGWGAVILSLQDLIGRAASLGAMNALAWSATRDRFFIPVVSSPQAFIVFRSTSAIEFRRFVMDGATIFVLVLTAAFFGFIAYLSIKSHCNEGSQEVKSEDTKPRNVA
jgi:hypothetical protein